jgi:hypothetical protein
VSSINVNKQKKFAAVLKLVGMTENKQPCYICEFRDKDPVLYGDFITASNVNSHYFCMLSGTNIPQTSKVRKGPLLGFTPSDILDSKIFYDGVKCYYCGKKSAAVSPSPTFSRKVFKKLYFRSTAPPMAVSVHSTTRAAPATAA